MTDLELASLDKSAAQTSLVVVGASVGMGRWLVEHLFDRLPWRDVTLVDIPDRKDELDAAAEAFLPHVPTRILVNTDHQQAPTTPSGDTIRDALIVLAVPLTEISAVTRWLSPLDLSQSTVAVVSERLVPAIEAASKELTESHIVGLHPLFERTTLSIDGQIVYVAPPKSNGTSHVKVTDLIRAAGGVVNVGTARQHDEIMKYVQAAAHQTLLNFMDVLTRSGLSIETDLWAARTPLFETLFGLATRVLEPRQRNAIVGIQNTDEAKAVASELLRSAKETSSSIAEVAVTSRRLDELGEHLSGSLFSTARHVANLAVTATQSTRTELSRHRARRQLVGLRLDRRPDVLHVGYIVEVGPTDVTLEDVYLPGSGRGAVLATGPGLVNRARVGAQGTPKQVVLNIGQVSLLTGSDLEHELDQRLAFIRRDVRFLVPESVSGAGVLRVIVDTPATRGHTVVSEVVRTGQRAVVVRLEIRADRDLDTVVESLRSTVQAAYAWPSGICRPARTSVSRILFLGPFGTFSESAARQCARAAQVQKPQLVAVDSFIDALKDIRDDAMAVLPICSSASGLVTRSFDALWSAPPELLTAGMVDVSVRIDAYIPPSTSLEQLRGAVLYSHPQALAQCTQFIRRWNLQPVPCESTAEALRLVETDAAPAAALAAADIDLTERRLRVGEREVDDLAGSITRFLVVGHASGFEEFSDEFAPTMRTIYLGKHHQHKSDSQVRSTPAYEERLSDADGNFLLITSITGQPTPQGLRRLGTAPWSPRTPIVRVANS